MSRQQQGPNVVVFLTDQQRWDSCGAHGNPLDLTPNFDRFARRGTHFENAFTCQPVCGPARACIQTGTYATTNGVFKNRVALGRQPATLAGLFSGAGYDTAYIGKWHLAGAAGGSRERQAAVPAEHRGGYDYWLAADALEFTSEPYATKLFDGEGNERFLPGHRIDALTDAAIDYLADRHDKPFFLFLSHLEPHHQNSTDSYPAPEGYAERYRGRWIPPDVGAFGGRGYGDLGGYCGMVKRLDEAFGRLLEALRSLGMERETVVLFTSDHGCHFGTRNRELAPGCRDDFKRSCHESALRVPAAMNGSIFRGGGAVDEFVSLVDIAPTLLDACGISVPAHMQGRSLVPVLRGGTEEERTEVFAQISESQVGRAVRTRRWKYSVKAPGADGFELSAAERYEEDCLYDLWSDPYELHNLIRYESHSHVADTLRERLLLRIEEVEGTRPEIVAVKRSETASERQVSDDEIV